MAECTDRKLFDDSEAAHPRTEKYKELIREFKYIQRRERENEQRRQKRKMMKEST